MFLHLTGTRIARCGVKAVICHGRRVLLDVTSLIIVIIDDFSTSTYHVDVRLSIFSSVRVKENGTYHTRYVDPKICFGHLR